MVTTFICITWLVHAIKASKKCLTNTTFNIVITFWWFRFVFILASAHEAVSWRMFLFGWARRGGEYCFCGAAALRL